MDQGDLDGGRIDNEATVSGQNRAGGTVGDAASTTVTAVANPALEMAKTASVGSFDAVGAPIAFTLTVRNTGNVTLSDLAVLERLPGATLNACDATTLAPGQTATCTADYAATQADLDNGGVRNDAIATADAPSGSARADAFVDVAAVQDPSLTLTKTADRDSVAAVGEPIAYTLVATNTGNVSVLGAQITDEMVQNNQLTNFACEPAGATSLAPQEAITCTGVHTVTQADLDAGAISNSAAVAGRTRQDTPVGPVEAN